MQIPSSLRKLTPLFPAVLWLCLCLPLSGRAQSSTYLTPGARSVHVYSDVYKTDFAQPWRKLQAGLEAGYHVSEKLVFTGGLEFWNAQPTPMISVGNRFHPFGPAFIRYRALIGSDADVALGIGYTYTLASRWQLQAASDYYLNEREIGFRLGLGYIWKDRVN
jgi:hypothetical protein